jgi:hypothetical protein
MMVGIGESILGGLSAFNKLSPPGQGLFGGGGTPTAPGPGMFAPGIAPYAMKNLGINTGTALS